MNTRAWVRVLRRRRIRATPGEVAKALGVRTAQVKRWIANGWLTAHQEWDWAADWRGRTPRGPLLIRWRAVARALKHPEVALAVGKALSRAANQPAERDDGKPGEPRMYVPASPPAGPSSDD